MSQIQSEKKGGRYTKKEQEERKLQVYHLHFEENKSAVEIAEILGVNRNTINDDIKFCFGQYENQSEIDIRGKMTKQIHRMEIQRERYFDYLDEAKDLKEKIQLEKLITDLDNKLTQFFSRMFYSNKTIRPSSSNLEFDHDKEVREIVKDLILSRKEANVDFIVSYEILENEFIKKTKCGVLEFQTILDKMEDLGLENFKAKSKSSKDYSDYDCDYDLLKFAKLRGYFSDEEIKSLEKNSSI